MTIPALPLGWHRAHRATQAVFLACGLCISSWAPLVPVVKNRLHLNDGRMGLLLLFMGAGALVMMPVAGWLLPRWGARHLIGLATVVMVGVLPLLLLLPTPAALSPLLFVFGAGVGGVDAAMNAHAVQVQRLVGKPILSSLHGLFSVGGLGGSLGLGLLMRVGMPPLAATGLVAALLLALVLSQYRALLPPGREQEPGAPRPAAPAGGNWTWLQRPVLLLGSFCFVAFLAEGAMLDWSALFLRDTKGTAPALAGAGFAAFSVATAAVRLVGDRLVARLSAAAVVVGGSLLGALGFGLLICSPWLGTTLLGFVLVGADTANIVPVFFSEGGQLPRVPSTVAIPAITTLGYAGQLAGPALLGLIAQRTSLGAAFGCTGALLVGVAGGYWLKEKLAPRPVCPSA